MTEVEWAKMIYSGSRTIQQLIDADSYLEIIQQRTFQNISTLYQNNTIPTKGNLQTTRVLLSGKGLDGTTGIKRHLTYQPHFRRTDSISGIVANFIINKQPGWFGRTDNNSPHRRKAPTLTATSRGAKTGANIFQFYFRVFLYLRLIISI